MTHYKSNLRDIKFNLFEVLGRSELLGQEPFPDTDPDTAEAILDEVDHLARTKLAESYVESDREPPVFDPQTHTAPLPEAFKKSYRAWMDAEFYKIGISAEVGGQPAPPSLRWAMNELVLGANPAVYMYASGPKFGEMIFHNGTARDKKIGRLMAENRWTASMVLTEPDAGSDVGAARTKAYPQSDGTWHIDGVKRFITCAEHDLSDQIIHVVLARPTGVEGAGGPGTKGLSMFIVPKYDFDPDTGELGERNGVYATGLEHKMGLRVSNTCELTFGAEEPAKGWLLGEVHDGIAQMFQIIEDARMMVGSKAIATLSTGYLNALDYAKERVQGADLTQSRDKTAPRVTITHHPDVRRSLLNQKAHAEGMRALMLYTASIQDRVALAAARGETDDDAHRMNDLLLPVVKGYGSERSWTLLGTESLQTLGGSGYLTDYPLEQYVRDAKIDTLYEGTTAIQGQDLFFRKIIRDQGRALGQLQAEIVEFLDAASADSRLKDERDLLRQALADVEAIGTRLAELALAADPRSPDADPRNLYIIGLNSTRMLMALGDVICGWLLLRGAEVALSALDRELTTGERQFYEGKVGSARWFTKTVLPKLDAERRVAESTDLAAMELDEAAF